MHFIDVLGNIDGIDNAFQMNGGPAHEILICGSFMPHS